MTDPTEEPVALTFTPSCHYVLPVFWSDPVHEPDGIVEIDEWKQSPQGENDAPDE